MTGEEFHSKYRLAERLTKPPVVTHQATDASGSPVLVHFLVGSETESGASYLEPLSQLGPAEKEQIREVIDVDGRPTVVTDVVAGFSTFQDWLDRVVPSKTAQAEPGAYTQLFRIPEPGVGAGSAEETAPPAAVPPPEMPAFPETPTASEPPDILQEVPETPPPLPPGEEGEGEGKPPGSYTMLFGAAGGIVEENQEGPPASATEGLPSPIPPPPPSAPETPSFPETPSPPETTSSPDPALPEEPSPPQPVFPTPEPPATPEVVVQEEPAESLLPWEVKQDPPPSPPTPAVQELPSPDQPVREPPPATEQPPATESGPGPGNEEDGKPGAYTQIFGRPTPAETPSPTPAASGGYGAPPPPIRPTAPPAQAPPSDPSSPDWERWRDTPGAAGRHIPSDDYLQRLGAAQSVGPGGVPPSSGPAGDPVRSAPPPPSAFPAGAFNGGDNTPAGPGHYTMIREGFSPDPGPPAPMASPAGTAGSAVPAPTPQSSPSRRSSILTVLGLVAVVLTIVALVVFFALVG